MADCGTRAWNHTAEKRPCMHCKGDTRSCVEHCQLFFDERCDLYSLELLKNLPHNVVAVLFGEKSASVVEIVQCPGLPPDVGTAVRYMQTSRLIVFLTVTSG